MAEQARLKTDQDMLLEIFRQAAQTTAAVEATRGIVADMQRSMERIINVQGEHTATLAVLMDERKQGQTERSQFRISRRGWVVSGAMALSGWLVKGWDVLAKHWAHQ